MPEGILIKSQGRLVEFYMFSDGCRYSDKITLPDNIHTVIDEESMVSIPHKFHQDPITCCADLEASGRGGSGIRPRLIPLDVVKTLKFGKIKGSQKPLKLDTNGNLTSLSLSGFIRKMSDETFQIFEQYFND